MQPRSGQERGNRARKREGSTKLHHASNAAAPVQRGAAQAVDGHATATAARAREPALARRHVDAGLQEPDMMASHRVPT